MLVTEYDLHAWQLFQQFTVQVDRLRGTDVLDYLPQLKGEINGIN
jgi:hypothetical protein